MLALLASQVAFTGIRAPLKALVEPEVLKALALSGVAATLSAIFALALAVPSAYFLAKRNFPGRILVDTLLDLPVVLSPLAVGFSLLLFFRTSSGGWIESHLGRFVFELPGIVLAQTILAFAVSLRVLKTAFEEIEPRYEAVARLLGCSPFGAFRRVTLPMARPGILAAAVLGWGRAVGDFGATVMVGGAVAGKTETVPVAIYLSLASVDVAEAVGLMLVLTAVAFLVLAAVRLLGRRS
jgi:molybdate transport system permease protein